MKDRKAIMITSFIFIAFSLHYAGDATGIPRQSWILNSTPVDSGFQLLDSGFQTSVGSGFLELCSGVQSPGFWIAWAKISWYPDSTSKNFAGPDSLQWGDWGNLIDVGLSCDLTG